MDSIAAMLTSLDESIMEYLIFRGFSKTIRAFSLDKQVDKLVTFSPDKVSLQLFNNIHEMEFQSAFQLWRFLEERFFTHLDAEAAKSASHLRDGVVKYCLCHAVMKGRKDKALEALTTLEQTQPTSTYPHNEEWQGWYTLPFVREPQKHPTFQVYFSTAWSDSLQNSVRNFISLVFRSCPPPLLLQMFKWYKANSQGSLQKEARVLKAELQAQKSQFEEARIKLTLMRSCVSSLASTLHNYMSIRSMTNLVTSKSESDSAESERTQENNPAKSAASLFAEDSNTSERHRVSKRERGLAAVRTAKECAQQDGLDVQLSLLPSSISTEEKETLYSLKEYQLAVKIEEWLLDSNTLPGVTRSEQDTSQL